MHPDDDLRLPAEGFLLPMTEKAIASFKFSGLGVSECGLRNSRCTLMMTFGFRLGVFYFL
jgi:hypothetical protein